MHFSTDHEKLQIELYNIINNNYRINIYGVSGQNDYCPSKDTFKSKFTASSSLSSSLSSTSDAIICNV